MPTGKILWFDKRDKIGVIIANDIEYYFDGSVVTSGEPKEGMLAWFDVNLELIKHSRCAHNVYVKPTYMQRAAKEDLLDSHYFLGQTFKCELIYPEEKLPFTASMSEIINILDTNSLYSISFNMQSKYILLDAFGATTYSGNKLPKKYKIKFSTQKELKKFKTFIYRSKTVVKLKKHKNKHGGEWETFNYKDFKFTNEFGNYWSAVKNNWIFADHTNIEKLVSYAKYGIISDPVDPRYQAP